MSLQRTADRVHLTLHSEASLIELLIGSKLEGLVRSEHGRIG